MGYEFIEVEREGHLTIVTINRAEVMNALHPPACSELDQAFEEFSQDPEAWVAIVTGAGDRAFCAGNDLKWQAQHGADAMRKARESLKGGFGGITRRFDCYKPLIAAVNGLALGGGFEIALACDIIVAAEHASFGLPEPRVGMMARAGGVLRLPRHIPYHLAMGLILTGRRISAQEAYRMGVVNEVVALSELMAAARRWASEILECAPLAVRAAKEAVILGLGLPLEEAISKVFPGIVAMVESDDFKEGPLAFAQKRRPQWKGR
ncbi:MAG: enoyl-CoA hydratase-related protein [Thermodesulfobacteriota bacterium]